MFWLFHSPCFNNVIFHLNEIKMLSSLYIRNYSLKSSPVIQQRGNLLCQSAWENYGNSWLTCTKTQVSTDRKNPLKAHVSCNWCNTDYCCLITIWNHCSYLWRTRYVKQSLLCVIAQYQWTQELYCKQNSRSWKNGPDIETIEKGYDSLVIPNMSVLVFFTIVSYGTKP